jgi:hypothetical protein
MLNCPKCNSFLKNSENEQAKVKSLDGRILVRDICTRYNFHCGAIVFTNEDYPEGTIERDCQRPKATV